PPPPAALRVRLEVDIPSDVRYIESIIELVQHECRLLHFPARHCALNVPVALSEALSNAILRGNDEDPEKSVRVRVVASTDSMVLEIRDEGEGFDLEASTHDPADPANLEREDGRGLFLMRALMDDVDRFDDGGNVVRLTLRRP
ncbi:MAG: ATP-binding protein, partial [Gemmatimonadaceae bacterium]